MNELDTQIQNTEFFKALSDPTRLKLITTLRDKIKDNKKCCQNDDNTSKNAINNIDIIDHAMCVCDLTDLLAQPQPTISRHLNHLKRTGILTSERRGTWMWYALNQNMPNWCLQVISLIDDK